MFSILFGAAVVKIITEVLLKSTMRLKANPNTFINSRGAIDHQQQNLITKYDKCADQYGRHGKSKSVYAQYDWILQKKVNFYMQIKACGVDTQTIGKRKDMSGKDRRETTSSCL